MLVAQTVGIGHSMQAVQRQRFNYCEVAAPATIITTTRSIKTGIGASASKAAHVVGVMTAPERLSDRSVQWQA